MADQSAVLQPGVMNSILSAPVEQMPTYTGDPSALLPAQMQSGMQQGQNLVGAQQARMQDLAQQEQMLRQAQGQMTPPSMSYNPQLTSPKGKGVLGGIGAVLGDVGKVAAAGLSRTSFGRDVYGIPRYQDYLHKQQQIASQIGEIQQQQGTAERTMGVGGQMASRFAVPAGRLEGTKATAQAKNYATDVKARTDANILALKQDLGNKKISVDQAKVQAENIRTKAMEDISMRRADIDEQFKNGVIDVAEHNAQTKDLEEQANEYADQNGFWGLVQRTLGVQPTKAVTPLARSGQSATGGDQGNKPAAKASKGKVIRYKVVNGQLVPQ